MPTILSKADQIAFLRHKRAHVLGHVSSERVQEHVGGDPFITIHCSDPYRRRDCCTHLFQTAGSDLAAPLSLPGIAVCISKKSPVPAARHIRKSTFFGVETVCKLGIKTLIFVTHAPCLVAYQNGIGFDFLLELLIDSKTELVKRFGVKVVMMTHMAFPEEEKDLIPELWEAKKSGKQLTYFVSRKSHSALFSVTG